MTSDIRQVLKYDRIYGRKFALTCVQLLVLWGWGAPYSSLVDVDTIGLPTTQRNIIHRVTT